MSEPTFPPLMSGLAVSGAVDPFSTACSKAELGCEAGLVVHNVAVDRMGAALVLAPEVRLEKAMAMLPLAGVGFQNALGALAPPEVAVHLGWNGEIRVNGAKCGRIRAAAHSEEPADTSEWLVVGFELALMAGSAPEGDATEVTALYEEGCADVDPTALLESWSRHTLNWISRWEDEGSAPLHAEWRGLVHGIGETTSFQDLEGTFLGIDEDFGMLLRDADTTHLIPLTSLLEKT